MISRRFIYATSMTMAIVVIIPIAMPCTVLKSERFHGLFYGGDVIQDTNYRLVREDVCRRACILTAGCRGVNMRWIGTTRDVGYCSLTAMDLKMVMQPKPDYSFYTWCPYGMKFSLTLSRCYVTIKQRKSWKESQDYCKTLHQQAHLMEIYDQIQDEVFQNMTNELLECKFTFISTEYMGHQNKTISGYTCQSWSVQSPHQHEMLNQKLGWTLEENYCRNPMGVAGTWCYTTDPNKRWDYCNVPNCADILEPNPVDPNNPSIGFWLGARRNDETADVFWIRKSLPVLDMEYSNFESEELASGTTGVDCVKSFRGLWSMANCSEVKAFVCEY